jgi:site-specific recombinase XerD
VRGPDILEGLDRAALRHYQVELADVLPNPRTRARALVALRSFLRFSCDEGWTDNDRRPSRGD